MINNRLLSGVMGLDSVAKKVDGSVLLFSYNSIGERRNSKINIYELAYKCKEWAKDKGYFLETRYIDDFSKYRCLIHYNNKEGLESTEPTCIPLEETEIESIFKACDWILEKKEIK